MRKLFFTLCISLLWITAWSQEEKIETKKNPNAPEIFFEETEHNFGTIPYKGEGECTFTFKNTGKDPLILTNVRSSCGCTVPQWPKEPFKKRKEGTITIKYDTRIVGAFSKTIRVYSNATNSPIVLTIKGKVELPKKEE
ncbi:MAG: DUF1573 domain-containing protein [Bacteroidales bacterium]